MPVQPGRALGRRPRRVERARLREAPRVVRRRGVGEQSVAAGEPDRVEADVGRPEDEIAGLAEARAARGRRPSSRAGRTSWGPRPARPASPRPRSCSGRGRGGSSPAARIERAPPRRGRAGALPPRPGAGARTTPGRATMTAPATAAQAHRWARAARAPGSRAPGPSAARRGPGPRRGRGRAGSRPSAGRPRPAGTRRTDRCRRRATGRTREPGRRPRSGAPARAQRRGGSVDGDAERPHHPRRARS